MTRVGFKINVCLKFLNACLILPTFLNSTATVVNTRVKKSFGSQWLCNGLDTMSIQQKTRCEQCCIIPCHSGFKVTSGWIPIAQPLNKELLSEPILVTLHRVKSLIGRCHVKMSSYPYMICLWRAALFGPVLSPIGVKKHSTGNKSAEYEPSGPSGRRLRSLLSPICVAWSD